MAEESAPSEQRSSIPEMPVSFCAVNCTTRFSKGSGVGFFQFPVDPRKKELWIRAISRVDASGRKWEQSVHDRICGVHFVSGRPSKDESAIDYVPTIFRDAKKRGNAEPNMKQSPLLTVEFGLVTLSGRKMGVSGMK